MPHILNGGGPPPAGIPQGFDARRLPPLVGTEPPVWQRGSVQQVGWMLANNHGGGYAFRLCKLARDNVEAMDEACFDAGHLDWVGGLSWAQFGREGDAHYNRENVLRVLWNDLEQNKHDNLNKHRNGHRNKIYTADTHWTQFGTI